MSPTAERFAFFYHVHADGGGVRSTFRVVGDRRGLALIRLCRGAHPAETVHYYLGKLDTAAVTERAEVTDIGVIRFELGQFISILETHEREPWHQASVHAGLMGDLAFLRLVRSSLAGRD